MSWAKIDDRFDDHPDYIEYSAAVMGLIACAITYANRHMTDGRIPRGWSSKRFGRASKCLERILIRDEVWFVRGDGDYEIAGFLKHNLSKAQILASREKYSEKRSEAGRAGGLKSAQARQAKVLEANAKQTKPSPLLSDPIQQREREARADAPLPFQKQPVPTTIEITETIRANCFTAGAPLPKPEDVVSYLSWMRAEGRMAVDYEAGLVRWMVGEKKRAHVAPRRQDGPVSKPLGHRITKPLSMEPDEPKQAVAK